MSQVNVKKLLHSKWTAVHPAGKEKHFIIVKVVHSDSGSLNLVSIEAVYTGQVYAILPSDLKDRERWTTGWK